MEIGTKEMIRLIPCNCRNGENYENDRKFHESHQILSQSERIINKLCSGKICQNRVRIKSSVDSMFSNMLYGKKRKTGNAGNQQKAF